jgi:hypothetical protein
VVPSDTEMDKARRFLCFGICVYCWQNGSLVLVVTFHLNIDTEMGKGQKSQKSKIQNTCEIIRVGMGQGFLLAELIAAASV